VLLAIAVAASGIGTVIGFDVITNQVSAAGRTVIVSTHDLSLATAADDVLLLGTRGGPGAFYIFIKPQ
jgi:ABC-type cobalamin transport system ATPase subunit